jgi:hypothetical protein
MTENSGELERTGPHDQMIQKFCMTIVCVENISFEQYFIC